MKNELIFVHEWIGPNGPINNYRNPDLYDISRALLDMSWGSHHAENDHDPIVGDIKKFVDCRIVSSWDKKNYLEKKFFYEINVTPRNDILKTLFEPGIGFLETTRVNDNVIDAVNKKQGYFLITNRFESFLEDEYLLKIHSYFDSHNIPLEKVIYLTNCFNSRELYEDFCQRFSITKRINCEFANLYLLKTKELFLDSRYEKRKVEYAKKERVFLNWNRRQRLHRLLTLLKFKEQNMLDKAYMSFSRDIDFDNWIDHTKNICRSFNINLSDDQLANLYDSLPFYLDSENLHRFPVEDDIFDTASWYEKTWVSLVSETNFENNIIHMTEKTIKPILFKQPFIIFGPPKTLEALKSYGIRTFNDFWDESYDQEKDVRKRYEAVMKLCKEVAQWDEQKLKKFYDDSKMILERNYQVMKNLNQKDLNRFVKRYGNKK